MAEKVPKVSASVNPRLDEQSVTGALKEVQERLRTGKAPEPPPPPPAPPVSRVRRTVGRVTDVAAAVGTGFRTRFVGVRRFTAGRMKEVAQTFSHGLTNIVMNRRAESTSELPESASQPAPPVVRQPPPAEPEPPPPEIVEPAILAPLTPPMPLPPAPVITAPTRTVNNYRTEVIIDPRRMREWLEVLALIEQLKAMNRALPTPVRARVYEWMSAEERADLAKTTFDQAGLISVGWSSADTQAYLKAQTARAQTYALLDSRLRAMKIIDARVVWREERHTRFARMPGSGAAHGPSGAPRRPGQFYFNKRFQGATYSVPSMLQNRKIVAAARPLIEMARQEQYKLAGLDYRAFQPVSTKPARIFWPSKWGKDKPRQVGRVEAVDVLWTRRLGMGGGLANRIRRAPDRRLLHQLLQND